MLFWGRNYQTTAACFPPNFCQETEFFPEYNKALLTPRTLFFMFTYSTSYIISTFL